MQHYYNYSIDLMNIQRNTFKSIGYKIIGNLVATFPDKHPLHTQKDSYICSKEWNMTTKDYILNTIRTNRQKLFRFGIRNVGLFGSYARNEQSDKSDIDILIDFEPEMENYDNYMGVCDIFEQLFRNEKVEIVTKNGLSPYIGPKILNEVMYV